MRVRNLLSLVFLLPGVTACAVEPTSPASNVVIAEHGGQSAGKHRYVGTVTIVKHSDPAGHVVSCEIREQPTDCLGQVCAEVRLEANPAAGTLALDGPDGVARLLGDCLLDEAAIELLDPTGASVMTIAGDVGAGMSLQPLTPTTCAMAINEKGLPVRKKKPGHH